MHTLRGSDGAAAKVITIPVGVSFEDRGMRNDQHDAVAVMLSVRGASQPAEESADREDERGASQLMKTEASDREDERGASQPVHEEPSFLNMMD